MINSPFILIAIAAAITVLFDWSAKWQLATLLSHYVETPVGDAKARLESNTLFQKRKMALLPIPFLAPTVQSASTLLLIGAGAFTILVSVYCYFLTRGIMSELSLR